MCAASGEAILCIPPRNKRQPLCVSTRPGCRFLLQGIVMSHRTASSQHKQCTVVRQEKLVPLTSQRAARATLQTLFNGTEPAVSRGLQNPWCQDTISRRPASAGAALSGTTKQTGTHSQTNGFKQRPHPDPSEPTSSGDSPGRTFRSRPCSAAPAFMRNMQKPDAAVALADSMPCTCGCKQLQAALGTTIGCSCRSQMY